MIVFILIGIFGNHVEVIRKPIICHTFPVNKAPPFVGEELISKVHEMLFFFGQKGRRLSRLDPEIVFSFNVAVCFHFFLDVF